jgi:hypothetical protein
MPVVLVVHQPDCAGLMVVVVVAAAQRVVVLPLSSTVDCTKGF